MYRPAAITRVGRPNLSVRTVFTGPVSVKDILGKARAGGGLGVARYTRIVPPVATMLLASRASSTFWDMALPTMAHSCFADTPSVILLPLGSMP